MKVLHVNNTDLGGRRFNGYDLIADLSPHGIVCSQVVLKKTSRDYSVHPLFEDYRDEDFQGALARIETRYGMNNLLYPWGRMLPEMAAFAEADVVHYHLIHNRVVSLLDLPALTATKPSVWSFHDSWPITGGCIHPIDCDGWQSTCEDASCASMTGDTSCARMWQVKQQIYPRVMVDVVVASEFMLEAVNSSPLSTYFENVHLIPFGINTADYYPTDRRPESRRELGVPEDHHVLLFRASGDRLKGLRYLLEALRTPPSQPTTLICVDGVGLVRELRDSYNILELGWLDDDRRLRAAYSACDVFVMPSLAEGFGLMALEAMASSRPVVCFDNTAVASITHAPECGVAVPMRDSAALRTAIDSLAHDPEDARRRGELGRRLAEENYSHDKYLEALSTLYHKVANRHVAGRSRS